MTDKTELERARPSLNYEDVRGLPANPTSDQEALASIAQSLKRLADRFAREEIARASAGGGVWPSPLSAGTYKIWSDGRVEALGQPALPPDAPSPAQAPETGEVETLPYLEMREALRTAEVRIKELEGELDEARASASRWAEYSAAQDAKLDAAETALADIRVHLLGVFAWTSAARHGIKNDPDPTFSLTNLEAFEARTRALLTDPSPTAQDAGTTPTSKGGDSDNVGTEFEPQVRGNIDQPARDTDTPAPTVSDAMIAAGMRVEACLTGPVTDSDMRDILVAALAEAEPAPAPDKALVEALEEAIEFISGVWPDPILDRIDAALAAARKVPVTPEKGDE